MSTCGLADTEHFYTVVQKKIVARYGKDFTYELKSKMMGKRALDAGRVLIAELQLGDVLTAEEFVKEREEALHDMFLNCDLMPGRWFPNQLTRRDVLLSATANLAAGLVFLAIEIFKAPALVCRDSLSAVELKSHKKADAMLIISFEHDQFSQLGELSAIPQLQAWSDL